MVIVTAGKNQSESFGVMAFLRAVRNSMNLIRNSKEKVIGQR
jgi:hypothetical protein